MRELVAEGRRALVFSQFVELLTLWRRDLEAEGIAYEYLDGSTTKRDVVVARFQEGQAPLFLISLKAGGAGLNLTAADTVIHCDPWWNPAVEDQATDRAYRIGQDKPVTVVRLVARGTIEEKILSLKAKKRELSKVVIGDDARALEGITEEDVRALLGDAEGDGEDATTPRTAARPRTSWRRRSARGRCRLRGARRRVQVSGSRPAGAWTPTWRRSPRCRCRSRRGWREGSRSLARGRWRRGSEGAVCGSGERGRSNEPISAPNHGS